MGSTFEETVLDFDLNFLHQPSNNLVNDCRIDKQRKALLVAKKKTIATDSLIKKYYSKRDQLEQTEVLLLSAKEECKQVCIDYKNSLEKCEKLEKHIQLLQNENKELQSNCVLAQNQAEAIKSHAHQLQVLVKEHETVIEALKIENQLEKNNVKDYEKNLSALQKEKVTLLSDLCLVRDIALGKKKLHKRYKSLLEKYEKPSDKSIDDTVADSSCDETDLFDSSPPSPLFSYENKNEQERQKLNENDVFVKKDTTRLHEDHDSDYSNEIVSEDTGRGSSLAFSDGEKCFNSPDYFCTDSPFSSDYNKTKERRIFVDSCTSPIMVHDVTHMSTSPLIFDDEALVTNNNKPNETGFNNTEYFITDIPLSTEIVTLKERKKMIDVGTSTDFEIELINISTSPVKEVNPVQRTFRNFATSPIQNAHQCEINKVVPVNNVDADNTCDKTADIIIRNALPCADIRHTTIQNLSSQCEIEISGMSIQEKTCLEKNNSNLCNENSNDHEIEMILNTMRMTDKLITPIPKTPVKLSAKCSNKNNPSPIKHLSELPIEHTVCQEAMKLRQENKILRTNIDDLSKEIMNIKRVLKNQLLMPETPKKQLCESNKKHNIMSELFDDSSHESICVTLNGELDNNNVDNDEIGEFAFSSVTRSKAISSSPPYKSSFIEESHIEEVIEECQVSKDAALRTNKSRKTSLHKDIPTVETINNNISESVLTLQSRKTIESNLRIEDDDTNDPSFCDSTKENVVFNNKKEKVKCKKLSRLEKFRKKLLPKSKIKRINVPIRKLRSKVKPKICATKNNAINAEIIMNNKSAYENALKVMAQIKCKKAKDDENIEGKKAIVQSDNSENKVSTPKSTDSRRNSKEDYLYNNVGNLEIKQPVICLSQVKMSNIGDKEKPQKVLVSSPKKIDGIPLNKDLSPRSNMINTRSRTKINQLSDSNVSNTKSGSYETTPEISENGLAEYSKPLESRRRLKRVASDTPSVESKRVLRSMNVKVNSDLINAKEVVSPKAKNLNSSDNVNHKQQLFEDEHENIIKLNERVRKSNQEDDGRILMTYTEISSPIENSGSLSHPKESILCKMLEKYARGKIKYSAKKIPDDISNLVCKKLEEDIAKIIELPPDKAKPLMNKLVEDIRQSWNLKNFLAGLMKYLKDPARKREMFNKVCSPPAPPMTKSEQVLLFVMRQLEMSIPNTVSTLLTQIEYSLFQLNRSPEFDIIESLSHFYALLCRYFGLKNRLRLFLLDAMYCLQFKVVPLIKHCLDVWMHILPLAHMGIAKSPLVTCLVYLLHFYKCEDKFNRIQEIRFILNKKYFYQITDWNETKILEMFRNSIKDLREIKVEKQMLRMAFIILAKRQGPKWCQKNIVKNMLLPMIEKEDIPIRIKQFCIELLGPLLKPYPIDMKVHCEIVVNQLLDMLDHKTPDNLRESIFTSLIYMNKHNQNRVTHSLLCWSPKHVSPEFEQLMRDFVREKPFKAWKGMLSRTTL